MQTQNLIQILFLTLRNVYKKWAHKSYLFSFILFN